VLDYASVSPSACRSNRKLKWAVALAILLVTYVSAYLIKTAFFLHPAVNMAYFMYTEQRAPLWQEDLYYYGFYPLYKLHKLLLPESIPHHNWDRTEYDPTTVGP
jgi:hypothetical protein